jgi:hypothetical protein
MPTHAERAALLAYARDYGWPLATAAASAADDEALAHACTWAWLAAADAR